MNDGFPWVERVQVLSVVDNVVDALLRTHGPAERPPQGDARDTAALCGEHGLAEVVRSEAAGRRHTLLLDFGQTSGTYLHNLGLLAERHGIDLGAVEALVLSHGHVDHWGGLAGVLEARRADLSPDIALYLGTDVFVHRWSRRPDGSMRDMGLLDAGMLQRHRVAVEAVTAPRALPGGAILSGEIARATPYEQPPAHMLLERDGELVQDRFVGEQALIFQLQGKGLVVLTACGHAGVVNSVLHARAVTGVQQVHAVVGGFHLAQADAERIDRTVEGLAALDPEWVVPMHCTGIDAIAALKARLGDRVLYNAAGSHYTFPAGA